MPPREILTNSATPVAEVVRLSPSATRPLPPSRRNSYEFRYRESKVQRGSHPLGGRADERLERSLAPQQQRLRADHSVLRGANPMDRHPTHAPPPRPAPPRQLQSPVRFEGFLTFRIASQRLVSPAGWPWADENLVLTAEIVLPGFVTLSRACIGEAAQRVVGWAEVGLDPMADGFYGRAVEGLGDAFGGPGAD